MAILAVMEFERPSVRTSENLDMGVQISCFLWKICPCSYTKFVAAIELQPHFVTTVVLGFFFNTLCYLSISIQHHTDNP